MLSDGERLLTMQAEKDALVKDNESLVRRLETAVEDANTLEIRIQELRAQSAAQVAQLQLTIDELDARQAEAVQRAANELEHQGHIFDLAFRIQFLEDGLKACEEQLVEERARTGEAMATVHLKEKQIEDLTDRLATTERSLHAANDKVDELESKIPDLEEELFAKRVEVEMLEHQEQEALDACEVEKVGRERAERERDELEGRLAISEQSLHFANERIEELESKLPDLEEELFAKQVEVEMLEKQEQEALDACAVEKSGRQRAERERDQFRDAATAAEEKARSLEGRLATSEQHLATANKKVEELKDDYFARNLEAEMYEQQEQEVIAQCEEEQAMRKAAEADRNDMAAQLAALLQQMEELKAKQRDSEERARTLEEANRKLEDRNRALEDRTRSLDDRNRALEAQLRVECEAHSSTRDDLDDMQTRLAVTVADNKHLKDQLEDKENMEPPKPSPVKVRRSLFGTRAPPKAPFKVKNSPSSVAGPPVTVVSGGGAALAVPADSPSIPDPLTVTSPTRHRRNSSSASLFQRMVCTRPLRNSY